MNQNNFETLPNAVQGLFNKLDKVETLLLTFIAACTDKDKPEPYVGIGRAAEITGLAKPTIYTKVHRNEIPHNKLGSALRFRESELIAWIGAHRVKSTYELANEATVILSTRNKR